MYVYPLLHTPYKGTKRDQKGTKREPIGYQNASKTQDRINAVRKDQQLTFLLPRGRFVDPFWCPLDFEGGPKVNLFFENPHKIRKMRPMKGF